MCFFSHYKKVKCRFYNFGSIVWGVKTELSRELQQFLYMPIKLHEEAQREYPMTPDASEERNKVRQDAAGLSAGLEFKPKLIPHLQKIVTLPVTSATWPILAHDVTT